ncbi:MAG: alpha/beta hydrolase [Caldilineaceae bacterium]
MPCELCAEPHVRHPSFVAYADFMLSACIFWQAGCAPKRLVRALPTTNIPTLLLTSAYDCALPPYLSQGLAASLPNSYRFVLPVGHTVVGSNCGLYLTDQFLAEPAVRPDATCIEGMRVEWLTH